MAKILNLDALSAKTETRELIINGVSHAIKEMTVQNFIETTRAAAKLSDSPVSDQIEATIEMLVRSIPTLKSEDLKAFDLIALGKIVSFVRGEDEGDAPVEPVGDEAGK